MDQGGKTWPLEPCFPWPSHCVLSVVDLSKYLPSCVRLLTYICQNRGDLNKSPWIWPTKWGKTLWSLICIDCIGRHIWYICIYTYRYTHIYRYINNYIHIIFAHTEVKYPTLTRSHFGRDGIGSIASGRLSEGVNQSQPDRLICTIRCHQT